MKNINNPIIDNRIVSDYTYAVRHLQLLSMFYPDILYISPIADEEFKYMCKIACELIEYQVYTCPDTEKWYFENLVKDYKTGKDIIKKFICKDKIDFYNFLKSINAV